MIQSRIVLTTICNLLILLQLGSISVSAAIGDREDPIVGTQTKPVPVTKEVLENKERKGAPAPSFNLLDDFARFFTKKPVEEVPKGAEKKRPRPSLFSEEKEYNNTLNSDNKQVPVS